MTQNARQLPSHSVDGSVLDLSTVFDENGNVAAITDNTASARQTRSMSYDGLDRLTATTSPMFGTASYAYDPQDNLTRVQVTGGSQPRDHYYCYNASNQLAFVRSGPNCTGTTSPAVIALAYDVQGNLSIKNGASYAFDFGNRLRTTAGQNYRYDAQGRRVRQDVAGSQLQYSQYAADGRLVWQRDETTNQRIANAYLAGSLLAEISRPLTGSTTTIRYQHTDALGSPIAKTSSTGAIIETSEYEPYGRLSNRPNDNRAGYTGHVMDAVSGLTYMQQRYYDPAIGAFLSVDPVTAYSSPVGAFNRYRYANGNPYSIVDPSGEFAVWVHWILTFSAARAAGYGFRDSVRHANRAWIVDWQKGSQDKTAGAAARHAMSVRNETPADASEMNRSLVASAVTQGDLGLAAHAIQDRFARGHVDFTLWDGFRALGIRGTLAHLWADMFPSSAEASDAYAATKAMFEGSSSSSAEGSSEPTAPVGSLPWASGLCGGSFLVGCESWEDPLPTDEGPSRRDGVQ